MLNGIAPIILFQFFKLTPEQEASVANIPIVSSIVNLIGLPPIPLYLDEGLTGVLIDNETKSIQIDTKVDTLTSGTGTNVQQKAVASTITVSMIALQSSIGVTLLAAMSDLILNKVTSGEYSITYMHKSIVLFNGLLESLTIEPTENTDKYRITMTLSVGKKEAEPPATEVPRDSGALPLSADSGLVPEAPASVPAPPAAAPDKLPPPPPPSFQLGGLG